MIVLDFETNTANVSDVVEVAAFRVRMMDNEYKVVDTFHRYYFSEYDVNPYALAVHKLSPQRLEELRKGVDYSERFKDDEEFVKFCQNAKTLVAHNASFEIRILATWFRFKIIFAP